MVNTLPLHKYLVVWAMPERLFIESNRLLANLAFLTAKKILQHCIWSYNNPVVFKDYERCSAQ